MTPSLKAYSGKSARCSNCNRHYPDGSLWVDVPDFLAEHHAIGLRSESSLATSWDECHRLNRSGVIWCLACAQKIGKRYIEIPVL